MERAKIDKHSLRPHKKKIILGIISIISCLIISVLIECFYYNYRTLTLPDSEQSIQSVPFEKKRNDKKIILDLDVKDHYIRKLIIDYEANNDTNYSISYTYNDLYNSQTDDTITDRLESTFNKLITNIDKDISTIAIEFEDGKNLKINNITIDNSFHFNLRRAMFIFLFLILICCALFFFRSGFKTEKIHIYFATFASIIGLMFLISQPIGVFYSWDDQTHFQRVVDCFGGKISYSNGEYNYTDTDIANSVGRDAINSSEEQAIQNDYIDSDINPNYEKSLGRLRNYSRIPYLPMIIGYHTAKLFSLPFNVCFMAGKILNLICYIVLMSYAIKTLFSGKRLLAIIALLPTNLFLACQYSYDPVVFAGLTVFLVKLFNIFLDKKATLDRKSIIIMATSISFACLAKAVYAPFLLLVFLIPKAKFKTAKHSRIIKIGSLVLFFILLSTMALPAIGGSYDDSRGGDTSVTRQLVSIITHPIDYLIMLKNTVFTEFLPKLFTSYTYSNFAYMGPLDSYSNTSIILFILIIFACLTDNARNTLSKQKRIATLLATLIIILLIWNALYLSFTPVGYSTINGVQNRYFLPLLFPILFCIQTQKIKSNISHKVYNAIILIIPAILSCFLIYDFILTPYSF